MFTLTKVERTKQRLHGRIVLDELVLRLLTDHRWCRHRVKRRGKFQVLRGQKEVMNRNSDLFGSSVGDVGMVTRRKLVAIKIDKRLVRNVCDIVSRGEAETHYRAQSFIR